MKFLFVFLLFFSLLAEANATICLCQYPTENSKFGSGYSDEVTLYKLGCKFWLLTQRNCRIRKTIKIDDGILNYTNHSKELIKLGFVGHWSGSIETTRFLTKRIEPLASQNGLSFEIDNTACSPMENPGLILKTLKSYSYKDQGYIRIKGSQAISIGMWDKVSPLLKSADVYAIADSRLDQVLYPACRMHTRLPCLEAQANETAYCISDGKLKKINCTQSVLSSKLYFWQYL